MASIYCPLNQTQSCHKQCTLRVTDYDYDYCLLQQGLLALSHNTVTMPQGKILVSNLVKIPNPEFSKKDSEKPEDSGRFA